MSGDIDWGKVLGWSLLILAIGSLVASAIALVWLAVFNRRVGTAITDIRDYMHVALSHTKLTADRAMNVEKETEKLKEKLDTLSGQVTGETAEFLPVKPSSNPRLSLPPVPPTSSMSWLVAPAMVLAAATMLGAAVFHYHTAEGPTVATSPAAAQAFDRAVTAQRNKEFKKALEFYRAAFDVGYDPVLSLFGVAECQFYLKDDAGAKVTCEQLLNVRGGVGRARFWLGHLKRRAGDETAARLEWEWGQKEGFAPCGMILAGTPHLRKDAHG